MLRWSVCASARRRQGDDDVGLGRRHGAIALLQARTGAAGGGRRRRDEGEAGAELEGEAIRMYAMPLMQVSYYSRLPRPCDKMAFT